MIRFFLSFVFLLTLFGCGEDSKTATTGTEELGSLQLTKSCPGGGRVSIYQKTSSHSGDGTITLKGFGLRSSFGIQGCPSSVNFQCTSPALTEAAFGNNFTGNEVYTCNAGKATFSAVSNTQTPYINTSPPLHSNPYSSSQSSSYQFSADIHQSQIVLRSQGPLKKPAMDVSIEFLITAGRYVPLSCAVILSCP